MLEEMELGGAGCGDDAGRAARRDGVVDGRGRFGRRVAPERERVFEDADVHGRVGADLWPTFRRRVKDYRATSFRTAMSAQVPQLKNSASAALPATRRRSRCHSRSLTTTSRFRMSVFTFRCP